MELMNWLTWCIKQVYAVRQMNWTINNFSQSVVHVNEFKLINELRLMKKWMNSAWSIKEVIYCFGSVPVQLLSCAFKKQKQLLLVLCFFPFSRLHLLAHKLVPWTGAVCRWNLFVGMFVITVECDHCELSEHLLCSAVVIFAQNVC